MHQLVKILLVIITVPNCSVFYHHSFTEFLLTLSMKYNATALCLILISFDFQSSLYWFRIRSTHFFNRWAVSYFCQSFSPCTNMQKHTQTALFLHQGTTGKIRNLRHGLGLRQDWGCRLNPETTDTLILELGFNMMYLMEPWMFSVHDASQVTLLSWRTSFHFFPWGGLGCLESL